jgi:hypothetical protein
LFLIKDRKLIAMIANVQRLDLYPEDQKKSANGGYLEEKDLMLINGDLLANANIHMKSTLL